MKNISDVVCVVKDYGTFLDLALKLSEKCRKVYYHSPIDDEYLDIKDCCIGDGLARPGRRIERIDEVITPEIIKEADLFCYPDIGFGGEQRYLRSIGKAVWGHMGLDSYEIYRTKFIKLLEDLGMDIIPWKKIVGLTNLRIHLQKVERKWIKINRYRQNMETWFHRNYAESRDQLDKLAIEFGGLQETIVFVVQDEMECDQELGYDGWCVMGEYPESSFMGAEAKNESYLGAKTPYKDLPDQIKYVNEKLSPLFKEAGYCDFMATEIRTQGDKSFFIDPTWRMPGQTGDQLLETCSNLPEVIWHGANKELIKPIFENDFAIESTMHHTGDTEWRTLHVPAEVERWTKLVHYCIEGDEYLFPPGPNDEVGVLLGVGNTIEKAIEHFKKNYEMFKDEPINIKMEAIEELLIEARKSEIKITDKPIPPPEIALKPVEESPKEKDTTKIENYFPAKRKKIIDDFNANKSAGAKKELLKSIQDYNQEIKDKYVDGLIQPMKLRDVLK